jgi:hypothetical protein
MCTTVMPRPNSACSRRLANRATPLFEWTPTRSIEDMDRAGTAIAITSVGHPGVWLGYGAF